MIVPHTTATHSGMEKGPGLQSRPSALPLKRLSLGVGPYLAVDLLDQGLAVLVLLLVLADLPELLDGKALQPLGDLRDGQLVVVGGLQRTEDGGFQLRLLCGFLGLPKDLIGLLCGLLSDPEPLPGYLLGGLKPLPGGLLARPHALPKVCEGGEEVPVGPSPGLGERPEAFLRLACAPREGLSGAHVLLGLLAKSLYGVARPALHELGVALLELEQLHATCEPLLGRTGVLLLQPHELEPVFGKPHAAALGGRKILSESLVGITLDLSHLAGCARRLLDTSGGLHQHTSVVVDHYSYVLITHIPRLHILKHRPVAWIQCQASRKGRAGKDGEARDGLITRTLLIAL